MSYRYSKAWRKNTPLGMAITNSIGWMHAVPRVGNLYPGRTTPLPKDMYPVSLQDACDNTAKQLILKYQTIYVLWSGGIDSTLVVAQLIKHRSADTKIIVSLNNQTVEDCDDDLIDTFSEYGVEFEQLSSDRMREIVDNGGMVVSGYHADSILVGEFVDNKRLEDVIFDITPVEMFCMHLDIETPTAEYYLRELEPLLALMPFERTAANIAWWLDFTCCWDRDEYDLMYRFNLKPAGIGYYNFFSSDDFQRWSMRDTREKAGRTRSTHKYQYRDIIKSVFGRDFKFDKNLMNHETYVDHQKINIFDEKLVAIDLDYSVIFGV